MTRPLWRHDLMVTNAAEFLHMELPEREFILAPVIPTQSCSMISAFRGVGKTHFSIGAALAIATGSSFLKYTAPKRRKVLFVDGEMPGPLLQERVAGAIRRLPPNLSASADFLRIVTPDLQVGARMPDLASPEGQEAIDEVLEDTEVLILDNYSTLFRSGAGENDEESWRGPQEWLVCNRSRGISTILIHHTNKNGTQRGTSKREDILDTSLLLRRPDDYRSSEGCRFQIHVEKGRSVHGADAEPFEATLSGDVWTVKNLDDVSLQTVLRLKSEGMTAKEIILETGIPRSTVYRHYKDGGTA